MTEPTTTTIAPTGADLRALLLELDAAPFTVKALRGKQEGMADLTLRISADTVRRFWAIAKALKEQVPHE